LRIVNTWYSIKIDIYDYNVIFPPMELIGEICREVIDVLGDMELQSTPPLTASDALLTSVSSNSSETTVAKGKFAPKPITILPPPEKSSIRNRSDHAPMELKITYEDPVRSPSHTKYRYL